MSGLYTIKPWFVRSLSGLEDRLVARRVSADALSFGAVAVSAAAAAALVLGYIVHSWWWFAVAPLALARLALNALDGAVARRTGTSRPLGKVVNEVCDRLSDLLLVAPLVLFVSPVLVVAALAVIWLTSTCGLLGEVIGAHRLTQGPMGKADRCAAIAGASLLAPLTDVPVGVFAGALVVMVFGGLVTIFARLRRLAGMSDVR